MVRCARMGLEKGAPFIVLEVERKPESFRKRGSIAGHCLCRNCDATGVARARPSTSSKRVRGGSFFYFFLFFFLKIPLWCLGPFLVFILFFFRVHQFFPGELRWMRQPKIEPDKKKK